MDGGDLQTWAEDNAGGLGDGQSSLPLSFFFLTCLTAFQKLTHYPPQRHGIHSMDSVQPPTQCFGLISCPQASAF